jgi:hypothetical protein
MKNPKAPKLSDYLPTKNQLAIAVVLQQSPCIPISLLDIVEIIAGDLRSAWEDFQAHRTYLENGYSENPPHSLIPTEKIDEMYKTMNQMVVFTYPFGLKASCKVAGMARDQLEVVFRRSPCTYEVVADFMEELHDTLRSEMAKKKMVFVLPDKDKFLNKDDLFGELVSQKFQDAKAEIKTAGNCLAFGFNTAAVFHLMRVSEIGLRVMAMTLKAPIKKSRIEFAGWSTLTKKIRKRIEVLEGRTNNAKKLEDLAFYHAALDEIKFFRDYWRNEVMHTRGNYTDVQAEDVSKRVENFMRRLAPRILKK